MAGDGDLLRWLYRDVKPTYLLIRSVYYAGRDGRGTRDVLGWRAEKRRYI
jgi:hypothetical protein